MDAQVAKLITSLPELSTESWERWMWNLKNALNMAKVWQPVLARDETTKKRPTRPTSAKPSEPTAGELTAQAAYDDAALQAAGWIHQAAGMAHREITEAHGATAASMLDDLEALYAQQTGGARFDAWTELLAIRKLDSETFPEVVRRVDAASYRLDCLRPADWSLAKETKETKTFVLLNAVPPAHTLISSLMANPDNLTYENVKSAFLMCKTPGTAGTSESASFAGSEATCFFCKNSGHKFLECNSVRHYQKIYFTQKAERRAQSQGQQGQQSQRGGFQGRGNRDRGGYSGNHTPRYHANAATGPNETANADGSSEYAGNGHPAT
ncbi:hypothetical protein M408DRAFT_299770 [Serendipita vermifera MAFF 305830]|uniref:Uncharacterized protein n=1 Tax=Serendipita vermifera MAFF 305830 TaxID=933852 RepID=A0A0C3AP92_SERVB|nr:hypothetical protein M408DRAFT_299770 [Serendipita vermifera MAFF 305830]